MSQTATAAHDRLIFVNLAVRDLTRSRDFFEGLGFAFDPRFSNDQAACMIVNDKAFVMLLTEPFFAGFTALSQCDTRTHTECLLAFSCESREAIDLLVKKAVETGGRHAQPPMDHGFMYGWSFYDPDGHHWELSYMDLAAVPWLQDGASGSPPAA